MELTAYLDDWFARRTGNRLPPAARLLLAGEETASAGLEQLIVLRLPSAEAADGVLAWPETRGLIAERLSPTVLAVEAGSIQALRQKLAEIGVRVEG